MPRRLINNTTPIALGNAEQGQFQATASGALRATGADSRVYGVTLTLDTSAYASADLVADTQAISTTLFDQIGGCVILDSIVVIDEDDQGVGLNFVFTTASTTFGTENSAPNIADADARNIVGHVAIAAGDYLDIGTSKIGTLRNLGLPMKSDGVTRALYVAVVNAAGTPTFTATGVRLKLGFRQS